MTEVVDGFGSWDDLGTIEPQFEIWRGMTEFTRSKSPTIRLFYDASDYDNLTYGFIRCLYQSRNGYFTGKWVRFYPKQLVDTITYPHPIDVLAFNDELILIYQIQKRHRFRRYVGKKYSIPWLVNVQVFISSGKSVDEPENFAAFYPTAYFLNLL